MAQQTRTTLKTYFETGDTPTQAQFIDLIDSSPNPTDDGTTGTGSYVRATSPTLVTPALGTPSALVATNATGTAAGLTAGTVTTNANLTGPVTSVGNATAIADAALSIAKTSGLQTALDGKQPIDADLTTIAGLTATSDNILQSAASSWASRTPAQVTATLPVFVPDTGSGGAKGLAPATAAGDATKFLKGDGTWASIPGGGDALVANPLSQFAATTSLQLKGVISDETGSGALVFATSPALVTPDLGTPSAVVLTNATGLPLSSVIDSTTEALGVGSLELGHASDTTLSRVSAGVVAVEGVSVLTTATGLPLAGGTMAGSITLGENTGIALDPAGSADGKWSGTTLAGTAGYAQTFGDLVYLDPTDSRWEKTDANSASGADGDARGMIGIVVGAGAADGSACTILLNGIIRADADFPAMTINAPMYVSETAGAITGTIPATTDAVLRSVGVAITSDEMYFNPSSDWATRV